VAPAVDRVVVESLPGAEIDWLLLQGDSDEVVSPTAVQNWLQSLQYPPKVVWLPGVGHFFHGALNALRDQVVEFLRADAGQIRAP
jgi:alpha/beta superfamily hydrolase